MNKANYVLLDAARMDGAIHHARQINPDNTCLYEGDSEKFLAAVAPWLFSFESGGEFAQWVTANGKRNNWGIFFRSAVEPVKLYKHLRRFLIVQTEEGRELYFRYYDPRILRVFLPTCDQDQLKEFFGPITAFVAEDENGLLVEYALSENDLVFSELALDMDSLVDHPAVPVVRAEQLTEAEQATDPGTTGQSQETGGIRVQRSSTPSKGWDFGY